MSHPKPSTRILLIVLGLATTLSSADERREPVYPRYDDVPRSRPAQAVVPEALRLDLQLSTARSDSRPADRRPHRDAHLLAAARRAAREQAHRAFRDVGADVYFRIGFYEGLRGSPLLRPDNGPGFDAGWAAGRHEPAAWHDGGEQGTSLAEQDADQRARIQVETQFRDLSRAPRFTPRIAGRPAFRSAAVVWPQPTLDELFYEFPVSGQRGWGPRAAARLDDWGNRPGELRACDSWNDLRDVAWDDPARAFRRWAADRPSPAALLTLGDEARARIALEFSREFRAQLARDYSALGRRSFDAGFMDGWAYGGFVGDQLAFRQGFARGANSAWNDAAHDAYDEVYPGVFERAYADAFEFWNSRPHVELGTLTLADAGDDGVFEPGEDLHLYYEVVNYGGSGGLVDLALDGHTLESSTSVTVQVEPRQVRTASEPLQARIRPEIVPRTTSRIQVQLAGSRQDLPLRVAYPLELDRRSVATVRRDLEGRLTVEADVVNHSRSPQDARLELSLRRAGPGAHGAGLGTLRPAGRAAAGIPLAGLDPLSLIAGEVTLELRVIGGGRLHDSIALHVPPTVGDLNNRDLLDLMLRLSLSARPDTMQVDRVRSLMLERLRVDWRAAVQANGNPYRSDYKQDTAITALGDLVQSYEALRPEVRQPQVFAGMGYQVAALAGDLPGVHPFLRKYARRLARELP